METDKAVELGLDEFRNELAARGFDVKALPLCELASILYKILAIVKESIGKGHFLSTKWIIRRAIAAIHGGISEWRRKNC